MADENNYLHRLIDSLYNEGSISSNNYEEIIARKDLRSISNKVLVNAMEQSEELRISPYISQLRNKIQEGAERINVVSLNGLPKDNMADVQGFIDFWRLMNYVRFWGNKYTEIMNIELPVDTVLDTYGLLLAEKHGSTTNFFWTTDMINEAYSMPLPTHNVTPNLVENDEGYFFVFEKPIRVNGLKELEPNAVSTSIEIITNRDVKDSAVGSNKAVPNQFDISWISILPSEEGLIVTFDVSKEITITFEDGERIANIMDTREKSSFSIYKYDSLYPNDYNISDNTCLPTLVLSLLNFLRSTATITKSGKNTRADRRRAKKQGITLTNEVSVNVVYLRPTKYYYDDNDHESTRKTKSYKGRFNVQGHWRNYWVGKGRTSRELRYVRGFQKGSGNLLNKIHVVNK